MSVSFLRLFQPVERNTGMFLQLVMVLLHRTSGVSTMACVAKSRLKSRTFPCQAHGPKVSMDGRKNLDPPTKASMRMATPRNDEDRWVGPPPSSTAQERYDDFVRSTSLSIDPSRSHPGEDPLRARSVSPAGPSSAFVFVPFLSLSRRGGWRLPVGGGTSSCGFARVSSLFRLVRIVDAT